MVGDRKSQIFTLISLFVVLIFGIFVSTVMLDLDQEDRYVQNKVSSTNRYYELIKGNYLKIVVQSSAKKALQAMTNYSVTNESLFPDDWNFSLAYQSLMKQGNFSINDSGTMRTCDADCKTIMVNNTLDYWIEELENVTSEAMPYVTNFSIDPVYSSILFYQKEPWQVTVSLVFNISLVSPDFIFSDPDYRMDVGVSILNMTDPLMAIVSAGGLKKPILLDPDNFTDVENNWSFEQFNESIYGEYFYQNDRGLNFLMRLKNTTQEDTYDNISGNFESFVLPKYVDNYTGPLVSYNSTAKRRSFVYHSFITKDYFPCDTATEPVDFLYNISGVTDAPNMSGFRVDFNTSFLYLGENFSDGYSVASCSISVGP